MRSIFLVSSLLVALTLQRAYACNETIAYPTGAQREALFSPLTDERFSSIYKSLSYATPQSLHAFFAYLERYQNDYPEDFQIVKKVVTSKDYIAPFVVKDITLLKYFTGDEPEYGQIAALALEADAKAVDYLAPQKLNDETFLKTLIRHINDEDLEQQPSADRWPVAGLFPNNDVYHILETRYKTFFNAVGAGRADEVRTLLATGTIDVNLPTFDCLLPLTKASEIGNTDMVSLLIGGGAQVNFEALMQAVTVGNEAMFTLMLTKAKEQQTDFSLGRLLTEAVNLGKLPLVEFLHKQGADLAQKDRFGRTLLHDAAYHGYPDIVDYLIKNKVEMASIDQFHYDGTALIAAVSNPDKDNADVVARLMESGFVPEKHAPAALHLAAQFGHVRSAEKLIAAGANMNALLETRKSAQQLVGKTPLVIAVENNKSAVVDLLLQKGADESIPDPKAYPPLHLAVMEQRPEIVTLFVDYKTALNLRDAEGRTPLHLALKSGYLQEDTVGFLVEKGARVVYHTSEELIYQEGDLPESVEKIIIILVEGGAGLNELDAKGMSPLDYVVSPGQAPE